MNVCSVLKGTRLFSVKVDLRIKTYSGNMSVLLFMLIKQG